MCMCVCVWEWECALTECSQMQEAAAVFKDVYVPVNPTDLLIH